MSYDDCECCAQCGDPIAFELFVELPDGDLVHRHCEEAHAEVQSERAAERAFEDEQSGGYSGAEVWSR